MPATAGTATRPGARRRRMPLGRRAPLRPSLEEQELHKSACAEPPCARGPPDAGPPKEPPSHRRCPGHRQHRPHRRQSRRQPRDGRLRRRPLGAVALCRRSGGPRPAAPRSGATRPPPQRRRARARASAPPWSGTAASSAPHLRRPASPGRRGATRCPVARPGGPGEGPRKRRAPLRASAMSAPRRRPMVWLATSPRERTLISPLPPLRPARQRPGVGLPGPRPERQVPQPDQRRRRQAGCRGAPRLGHVRHRLLLPRPRPPRPLLPPPPALPPAPPRAGPCAASAGPPSRPSKPSNPRANRRRHCRRLGQRCRCRPRPPGTCRWSYRHPRRAPHGSATGSSQRVPSRLQRCARGQGRQPPAPPSQASARARPSAAAPAPKPRGSSPEPPPCRSSP
mmetsp:Transcript_31549/g.100467  ORF Transcript_31549/g.100467 Transcript_31549/m.100467 type:complete len:396 (-) Transcript_31549:2658-3845(-)